MAKVDVVTAGVTAIQSGEVQLYSDQLGIAYDAGAVDQKASDGTLSQGDLDAAVKAATDPLNAQIAADVVTLQAAHDDAATQLAALQANLDALSAKEKPEAALIASLQASAASLTQALAAINDG